MSECTECEVTEISIHALRGEGDEIDELFEQAAEISIHALRGEGDDCEKQATEPAKISIHALRGEGDGSCLRSQARRERDFNPRPPWGGRLRERDSGSPLH